MQESKPEKDIHSKQPLNELTESLDDYRKSAIKILKYLRIKLTEERIGVATSAIMVADTKYVPEISKRNTFRICYVKYYIGDLNRFHKRFYRNKISIEKLKGTLPVKYIDKSEETYEWMKDKVGPISLNIIKMLFWDQMPLKDISIELKKSKGQCRKQINETLESIRKNVEFF